MTLREDDELIEVKRTNDEKDIFLVTKYGMCIRFHETDVRSTGRVSMGVIGMTLSDGDEVVGMQLDTQGKYLLTVSEKGMGKLTDLNEFTAQIRGGKGVKCYKIMEKTSLFAESVSRNSCLEWDAVSACGVSTQQKNPGGLFFGYPGFWLSICSTGY